MSDPVPIQAVFSSGLQKSVKLGRKDPTQPCKAPRLSSYLKAGDPISLPAKVDYATAAMDSLDRMYLNDQLGCCVITGKMHKLGLWSANDKSPVILATDEEVRSQYKSICGPFDNGCVITEVLDVFKDRGLKAGGVTHKIDGYVQVDWTNQEEVKAAIYLFGSLTLGINIPSSWVNSSDGDLWDKTVSPIVGGHDVCTVGYDERGVQISTWGGLRTITWAAFTSKRWLMECYACLAPSWYGSDRVVAATGFNADKLAEDLILIGNGQLPDVTPPAPPAPPAPPTPPVPPAPPAPQVFSGNGVGTLTGPFGWFGREKTVAVQFSGLSLTLGEAPHHRMSAAPIPWQVIVRIAEIVVPLVIAGWKAGKVPWQIVVDVVGALIGGLLPFGPPNPPPSNVPPAGK